MILFGSHARGDFHTVSDIDLAVSGGDFNPFALDTEECIDTLLKFDIINLNAPMEEELLESINKDGIIIYEKYENFCRALENLKDIYQYDKPYNNVILSGLVALYEICFEQAWKAMKEIMSAGGIREADTGSPK